MNEYLHYGNKGILGDLISGCANSDKPYCHGVMHVFIHAVAGHEEDNYT
jgi:hypothetical protein